MKYFEASENNFYFCVADYTTENFTVFKIFFSENKIGICNVKLQQHPPVTIDDLLSWEQVSTNSPSNYLLFYVVILCTVYLYLYYEISILSEKYINKNSLFLLYNI